MGEIINTCSGAISLAKKLEDDSSEFYKTLSEKDPEHKDIFSSFAEENGKFYKQIERAYYGVISDALEGCFSFNIDPDLYELKTELEGSETQESIKAALEIEDKIIEYYTLAAEQSKSLMADVPRAFKLVVKKRQKRQDKLRSL